jgi:hypothetical protein
MRRLPASQWQTVQQYSQDTGIKPELIRRYCRLGRLQAQKIGKRWIIRKGSKVEDYAPRLKDGTYVGMNDLKRGDTETFLKKRGIII